MSEELRRRGWDRVWTAPNIVIVPSYWEAMEQGIEEDKIEDARWQAKWNKEWREIISSFKPEDWDEVAL